jgi:hypothetical protein
MSRHTKGGGAGGTGLCHQMTQERGGGLKLTKKVLCII